MFKTMKVSPKQKKAIAIITILVSSFLTYHYATEEEQAVQEADAIENIKDIAKEQVEKAIAPDSAVVDTPAVEAPKPTGSLDSEMDSLVKAITEAQTE